MLRFGCWSPAMARRGVFLYWNFSYTPSRISKALRVARARLSVQTSTISINHKQQIILRL
jgi:hypothetical protein